MRDKVILSLGLTIGNITVAGVSTVQIHGVQMIDCTVRIL